MNENTKKEVVENLKNIDTIFAELTTTVSNYVKKRVDIQEFNNKYIIPALTGTNTVAALTCCVLVIFCSLSIVGFIAFIFSIIYLIGISIYGVQKVKEIIYGFKIKWLQDSINSTTKVTEAVHKLIDNGSVKEEIKEESEQKDNWNK